MTLPAAEWVQVGVTYDGSGTAEGMTLLLNGKPVKREIVRDHLSKARRTAGAA